MVATTRAQTNPPGQPAEADAAPQVEVEPKETKKKSRPAPKKVITENDKAALLPFDMQKRVNELPMDQLAELAQLAAKTLKKTTLNRTQTVMKNAAERALKVQTKQAKKQEKVDERLARKNEKVAKKQAKEDERVARKEAKKALKIAKANPWHEQDQLLPVKSKEQLEEEKKMVKENREAEAKKYGFGMQSCFVNTMNKVDNSESKNLRPALQKEIEQIDEQMDASTCFDGSTRGFGDKAVFEMAQMCKGSLKRKLEDAMEVIRQEAIHKKKMRKSIDNKSYNARRKAKRLAAEKAAAGAPIIEDVASEANEMPPPPPVTGGDSPLIQAVDVPPTPAPEMDA